MVNSSF